jgi:O-antigen ligase
MRAWSASLLLMASSETVAAARDAVILPALPHDGIRVNARAAFPPEWIAIGVALVAPWWLPLLANALPTFYKEWLFVLAVAFAGLIAKPSATTAASQSFRDPLVLVSFGCVAVLLVQMVALDGVWRRATLTIFCAALFVYAMALGKRMQQDRGDSLAWIVKCVLVSALGSCLFAAAQLAWPSLPFVLPLSGPRLYGNVAQANHFGDLLWIGCVATAHLYSRGSLRARTALGLVLVMQFFAATSGSRMAWIYSMGLAVLGLACWRRTRREDTRRLGAALIALVLCYGIVTAAVGASGVLETLGLTSAEQRAGAGESSESNSQRLWFWRVGFSAALDHPLIGVGVGRFAGEGLALAMEVPDFPRAAADAQAHNIFVQLAAELGIPLALAVALALTVWLVRAWRNPSGGVEAVSVIAMALPILVHANLEHPLGYLYFLGLLGLLFGQVRGEPVPTIDSRALRQSPELLRFASFAILGAAGLAYVQFAQVERAMQVLTAQMKAGAPPQPSRDLATRLSAVPKWSIFGDYAELITLIAAVPTQSNAAELARRCERAIAFGPSPHLLARCATAQYVAGQLERASYFANALCRIYPDSVPILIQSMTFVEQTSPAVEDLRSTCVQRTD